VTVDLAWLLGGLTQRRFRGTIAPGIDEPDVTKARMRNASIG
jgi:hypothetical protein